MGSVQEYKEEKKINKLPFVEMLGCQGNREF